MSTSPQAKAQQQAWPMSHPIEVAKLPGRVTRLRVAPDEAQRKAMAKMLDILAVETFEADVTLEPRGSRVIVGGSVKAAVKQTCVVTLEPVDETVEESIDFVFAPEDEAAEAEQRVHAAAEKAERAGKLEALADLFASDNLPDPIVDGVIDIGHVVVETLAIGLDPYPRKPGVAFVQPEGLGGDVSPFAALGKLKT